MKITPSGENYNANWVKYIDLGGQEKKTIFDFNSENEIVMGLESSGVSDSFEPCGSCPSNVKIIKLNQDGDLLE